jgi:hypothetical protein
MRDRVSIRDIRLPANESIIGRRNSKASCANDFCANDLAQLLPLWPKDLGDRSPAGRKKLIAVIERELRKERQRGIAGNSAYDVLRHAKLIQILKEERRSLAARNLQDLCARSRRGALETDQLR